MQQNKQKNWTAQGLSKSSSLTFFRTLGYSLDAGLPLSRILRMMSDEIYPADLRTLAAYLEKNVAGGLQLSDGLHKAKSVFSPHQVALVKAGEKAGRVADVMFLLAEAEEKMWELRAKLTSKLAYPLILLIFIAVGFGIFFPFFVFPQYLKLVEMVQVEPGSLFDWVLSLMRWTGSWSCYGLIFVGVMWLVSVVFSRVHQQFLVSSLLLALGMIPKYGEPFKRIVSTKDNTVEVLLEIFELLCSEVPFLSGLWKFFQSIWLTHFSRMLSLQLKSGIILTQALPVAIQASGSSLLASKCEEIMRAISTQTLSADSSKDEASLSNVLMDTGLFPTLFCVIVAGAEEHGSLSSGLDYATKLYQETLEEALETGTTLLEPLLMFGVGSCVGASVLMMLLPIVKVVEQL
jgi:type IV pilus assembly protein PilC